MKKLRLKKFKLSGLKGKTGLKGAKPLKGKTGLTGQKAKRF